MQRILLLFFIFSATSLNRPLHAQAHKIIFDGDPGIDDAMALVLALQSPEIDILGITTMFGNVTLQQATSNALRIVEISGRHIPVYMGADKPLKVPLRPPPDFVHGKDGLGNTNQPAPSIAAAAISAAQFMVNAAKAFPGQITIVAVGRLTNIAHAMQLDSNFVSNVKNLVVMGGALRTPGNVTPVAEANIYGDPHAADMVFTAPWQVTMIGLDVTQIVKIDDELLLRIKNNNHRYGSFLYDISRFYMNFHKNVDHVEGGFYVHDPSAVMYLLDSSLFNTKKGPVRVVTEGIAIGQTIMPAYDFQLDLPAWKGYPGVTAATAVDTKRFLHIFETVMTMHD